MSEASLNSDTKAGHSMWRTSARRIRAIAKLLACLVVTSMSLFAQGPLEQYVEAFVQNRPGEMRSIVANHDRELSADFFQLLQESADKLQTDRDLGAKYLIVAIALSQTFEEVDRDRLYDAFKDGSSALSGDARRVYSGSSLSEFLVRRLADVHAGLTYSASSEIESVVKAYERSRIPEPIRRLQEEIERQKAKQAELEAAARARKRQIEEEARERQRKIEEEARERELKKKIAQSITNKDFGGLRKLYNSTTGQSQREIYDALIAAGDETFIADVTKAWILRLGDANSDLRTQAAAALVEIGAPAAPFLVNQMRDRGNPDLGLAIARILLKINYQPGTPDDSVYLLLVTRNVSALVVLGSTARPGVLSALRSVDNTVLLDALWVIGEIGSEQDVSTVKPLLSHPDSQVRGAAQTAVWRLSSSLAGKATAFWLISPVGFVFVVLVLVIAVWLSPRLFRWIHPPFSVRVSRTYLHPGTSREETLADTLSLVSRTHYSFPQSLSATLEREASAGGRPETHLLLARDAALRGDPSTAATHVQKLWDACASDADLIWIAPHVGPAMSQVSASTTLSDALRPFEELSRSPHKRIVLPLIQRRFNRNPDTLRKILEQLAQADPLPRERRDELEGRIGDLPEVLVVLANDDFRIGQFDQAAMHLALLAERVRAEDEFPRWIVDEALKATEANTDSSDAVRAAVLALKVSCLIVKPLVVDTPRKPEALRRALAEMAKIGSLPPESRTELERHKADRPEVLVVLAEDDVRSGRLNEASSHLSLLADRMRTDPPPPDWIVDEAAKANVRGSDQLKAVVHRLKTNRVVVEPLLGGVPQNPEILRKILRDMAQIDPLSADSRQELEQHATAHPEALIVLASDDIRTGDLLGAAHRLRALAELALTHNVVPKSLLDEALATAKPAESNSRDIKNSLHLIRLAGCLRELLIKQSHCIERASELASIETEIREFRTPLPDRIRSSIEAKSANCTDLEIVLAYDDFHRESGATGLERLMRLLKKASTADQISKAALDAWANCAELADSGVQTRLWESAHGGSDDAWAALALLVLQRGRTVRTPSDSLGQSRRQSNAAG